MAVFRVEKSKDYTVMSNYHLRDSSLSLKAKGLLSQMLSLPEGWDYTLAGLAKINREGDEAISTAVKELEQHGYIHRRRTQNADGKFTGIEYLIYEHPVSAEPLPDFPVVDNPEADNPVPENPGQLSKDKSNKDLSKKKNKKEKKGNKQSSASDLLSETEMKNAIIEWIAGTAAPGYPREVKNELYEALRDFYNPNRSIKKGSPPMHSLFGLSRVFSKLVKSSGGNPYAMIATINESIENCWSGLHPPEGKSPAVPPKKSTGRYYEEL